MPDHNISDVIIVLGAAVRPGGKPSPALASRISKGIALLKSMQAGYLLLTGGVGEQLPSEAEVMKRIAIENNVPENRIIKDESASNTFDSAINCIKIMDSNQWDTAILVTDDFHLYRSVFLFKALGKPVKGIAANNQLSVKYKSAHIYYSIREAFAFLWYLIRIIIYRAKKFKS